MLFTMKLSKQFQDLIKFVIGIKVVLFVFLNILESTGNIKDLQEKDECIEHMTLIFEKNNDAKISRSKAFHYCSGGTVIKN